MEYLGQIAAALLFGVLGEQQWQQRSMTLAPWGAEACVSHWTPGSVYVFFSHPRSSVSLPPCYVSASLPPFSLRVEVFLGLSLPFCLSQHSCLSFLSALSHLFLPRTRCYHCRAIIHLGNGVYQQGVKAGMASYSSRAAIIYFDVLRALRLLSMS